MKKHIALRAEPTFSGTMIEWETLAADPGTVAKLQTQLRQNGISLESRAVQQLIAFNIGGAGTPRPDVQAIVRFLKPSPAKLVDYSELTIPSHLNAGLNRLQQAIATGEKILINGDPDADGTPGAAVLTLGLKYLGANVSFDFPVRSTEGHGLQPRIIEDARRQGVGLIMTVDCGSKDLDAITFARDRGMDVIVTDHHIVGKTLSNDAVATINPRAVTQVQQEDQVLAGGSVAMKLMFALMEKQGVPKQLILDILSGKRANSFQYGQTPEQVAQLEKVIEAMRAYVALSTISDRMSLLSPQNREIVSTGVRIINETELTGLKNLMDVGFRKGGRNRDSQLATERELSFQVVPLINATGRIGNVNSWAELQRRKQAGDENVLAGPGICVELMTAGVFPDDKTDVDGMVRELTATVQEDRKSRTPAAPAEDKAENINDINKQRKLKTFKLEDELVKLVKSVDLKHDRVIALEGEDWDSGVIGIAADRLREEYGRPVVLMSRDQGSDYFKASCRSIPSIDLYQIVDDIQEEYRQETGKEMFAEKKVLKDGSTKEVVAFGGHTQALGFTLHKSLVPAFKSRLTSKMDALEKDTFVRRFDILETVDFKELLQPDFFDRLRSVAPFGQHFDVPLLRVDNMAIKDFRLWAPKGQNSKRHVSFVISDSVKSGRRGGVNVTGFGKAETLKKLGFHEETRDERAHRKNAHRDNGPRYDILFTAQMRNGRLSLVLEDIRPA